MDKQVRQWSFIKIRTMWHWVLIVHISENFNCFSSVSVLYRIRFICSLIALLYWLVWLLQLFHGGKKMKPFHMGIVFLISIFTVFYVYCMLLCLLSLLLYWVTLCIWFSTWMQNIENIFWKHPIHSYPMPLIDSSPWFQLHSNKKFALENFQTLKMGPTSVIFRQILCPFQRAKWHLWFR